MDSNNPTPSDRPSTPPKARRAASERERHGGVVADDYAWLRTQGKDDPEVRAYLEAENAWTEASLSHVADLRGRLFEEIKGRIQETDLSVPVRKGDWWYYSRTQEGAQYPIHCRKAVRPDDGPHGPSDDEVEQVMLDQNVEVGDAEFFAMGAFDATPDARVLAWSSDTDGDEVYTMRFRDLATGADLDDVIEGTYYGTAWAADNRTFFYVRPDEAMRPYQLWRHRLGTPASDDVLVHTEDDERFFLGVGTTKDERYLVVGLGSKVTSEIRVLEADEPTGAFRVVEPRRQDIEYALEHWNGRFLIVTNDDAENFRLVSAPAEAPDRSHWEDVVPHRADVTLSGIDVFARHLVLFERADGLRRIRVRALAGDGLEGDDHLIDQPEEVSTASGGANPEFDSTVLRYGYTSMVTPSSVFDYDMDTRERTLLKQQPVLGGYDPLRYVTERLWAMADDGAVVPISVVRRADRMREVGSPALLYGYGSYEASMDPTFSSARLSLLDRGFVFAIAHVRGGGEMGRRWYNEGKLLRKRNTFTDFIACARYLVEQGWTSPSRLAIRGGSAGGLLVGAALNLAPEAFGAAVAEVPFVDVVEAILDASLPLTVLEWEEWGNPVDSAEAYAYMTSYDPYLNVAAQPYPPMLVTAGINDPRVPYWQPAKWVARLRAMVPGARVLLKTEMGAGHMGPSGRYDAWRDEALVYAFLLDALAVADAPAATAPLGPFAGAAEPPGPFA